jgi:NAD-dependent DNA ligase
MRALILLSATVTLRGFQVTRLPGVGQSSFNSFSGGCLRTGVTADSSIQKRMKKILPAKCAVHNEGSQNSVGHGDGVSQSVLKGLILAITGNFGQGRDSVVDMIKDLGAGDISPTVHKRVDFLLADDGAVSSETKHIRKAVKYGVKIVSLQFLEECKDKNTRVDPAPYLYHVTLSRRKEDLTD